MNRRRRPALQIEPLEGKLLLAYAGTHATAALAVKAQVQTTAAPRAFALDGALRTPVSSIKTYVSNEGAHIGTFTLTGRLKGTGQVRGTYLATLDPESRVMQSGGITFTNRRGSVILTLANDPNDNTSYLYTVASGTGKFAGATGSGKVSTSGMTPNGKTLFFGVRSNAS